ncbi:hypothetical protein AB1N83_007592 [Pleurotus pulmonarius]
MTFTGIIVTCTLNGTSLTCSLSPSHAYYTTNSTNTSLSIYPQLRLLLSNSPNPPYADPRFPAIHPAPASLRLITLTKSAIPSFHLNEDNNRETVKYAHANTNKIMYDISRHPNTWTNGTSERREQNEPSASTRTTKWMSAIRQTTPRIL